MIKKSITAFIFLFISYSILISLITPKMIFHNQWQLNRIQAQEYLYNKNQNNKIVIVGTSLSARLDPNLFPENTYNLALAGLSPFDGLEIVKRKKEKPAILLIEINHIDKKANKPFLENLFLPVMFTLRKNFPALRERYHSLCSIEMILYSIKQYLSSYINKLIQNFNIETTMLPVVKEIAKKQSDENRNMINEPAEKVKKTLFQNMLKELVSVYEQIPHKNLIEGKHKLLKDYKNYFEKYGVKIIPFEMPIHEKLIHSNRLIYIREMMREIFPPDRYDYIQPENIEGYDTTDGIHLTPNSVISYSKFIANKLNKFSQSSNKFY